MATGPNSRQQVRRANYNVATRMNKHQLKKATANAYSNYLQKRETNPNQAKLLKQKLIGYRHRLTQELLGGSAGSGFNPGLSKRGGSGGVSNRKATRQMLKAKLGNTFNAYYFTKDKARQKKGGSPFSDSIKPPKYNGPKPTSKYPGGRIGPPNTR